MILKTQDDVAILLARLVLGGVMFPHGVQKAFGLFGGYGFRGTKFFNHYHGHSLDFCLGCSAG